MYAAQATLKFIQKVFPLRRCHGYQGRPCLYYHMGQCLGACFNKVPQKEYDEQIKKIKSFLNGDIGWVKQDLTEKMSQAAANLEFERAAEIRDQLKYIEETVEKQKKLFLTTIRNVIFLIITLINHGSLFRFSFCARLNC